MTIDTGHSESALHTSRMSRLEGVSIPELLWELHQTGWSGALLVERERIRKALYFRDGRIVFSASTDPEDRLGAFLFRRGEVDLVALIDAGADVMRGRRLGQVLINRGLIEPAALVRAVTEQVREVVLSIFPWRSGSWRLSRAQAPVDETVTLDVPMEEVILAGVRRVQDGGQVRAAVGGPRAMYRAASDASMDLSGLGMTERAILDELRSPQRVEDLCAHVIAPSEVVLRAVWGMSILGLIVRVEPQPAAQDSADPLAARDGRLDTVGVAGLLLALGDRRFTGAARLFSKLSETTVFFRDGLVDFAVTNDAELNLGAHLLRRGLISHQDRDEAARRLITGRRLGVLLAERGALEFQDVGRLVREQVFEIVKRAALWTEGEYELEEGRTVEEPVVLGRAVEDVVLAAYESLESCERLWSELGGLETFYRLRPEYLQRLDRIALRPGVWDLVSLVKEESSVRDILARRPEPDIEICRWLCGLTRIGVLEKSPAEDVLSRVHETVASTPLAGTGDLLDGGAPESVFELGAAGASLPRSALTAADIAPELFPDFDRGDLAVNAAFGVAPEPGPSLTGEDTLTGEDHEGLAEPPPSFALALPGAPEVVEAPPIKEAAQAAPAESSPAETGFDVVAAESMAEPVAGAAPGFAPESSEVGASVDLSAPDTPPAVVVELDLTGLTTGERSWEDAITEETVTQAPAAEESAAALSEEAPEIVAGEVPADLESAADRDLTGCEATDQLRAGSADVEVAPAPVCDATPEIEATPDQAPEEPAVAELTSAPVCEGAPEFDAAPDQAHEKLAVAELTPAPVCDATPEIEATPDQVHEEPAAAELTPAPVCDATPEIEATPDQVYEEPAAAELTPAPVCDATPEIEATPDQAHEEPAAAELTPAPVCNATSEIEATPDQAHAELAAAELTPAPVCDATSEIEATPDQAPEEPAVAELTPAPVCDATSEIEATPDQAHAELAAAELTSGQVCEKPEELEAAPTAPDLATTLKIVRDDERAAPDAAEPAATEAPVQPETADDVAVSDDAGAAASPSPEILTAVERFNRRHQVVFESLRREIGAGARNFVLTCLRRLGADAAPFEGSAPDRTGAFDREALARRLLELSPADPQAALAPLISLELTLIRDLIDPARMAGIERALDEV